ncbi:MAG TPA: hypothetical protein VFV72_16085 [Candidatus Limnocylindrales bacterium]|nr:hypothetical protein [Candidatus Limnocylindrales bacterium]
MSDLGRPPVSERLRWDDGLTKARSRPAFLRSRLRIAFAISAVVMLIGSLMPWAEGMVGRLPKSFGGFDGAADGLILAALAVVALLFARSPEFLDAPDGLRRWAPMLLGLVCVGLWLLGFQAAQFQIAGWVDDDGHGSMTIGYWIAGIGALALAVAGSYATLRYHEGQTTDPTALIRLPRRSDAPTLFAWVFGLVGLVLGASVASDWFEPAARAAPMLFMAAAGIIAGAYLGRALGRLIRGS